MFQFMSEDLSLTVTRHPRILNPFVSLGKVRNTVVANKSWDMMIMVLGLTAICCLHSCLRNEEAYQLAKKLVSQVKREYDSSVIRFSHINNECKSGFREADDQRIV